MVLQSNIENQYFKKEENFLIHHLTPSRTKLIPEKARELLPQFAIFSNPSILHNISICREGSHILPHFYKHFGIRPPSVFANWQRVCWCLTPPDQIIHITPHNKATMEIMTVSWLAIDVISSQAAAGRANLSRRAYYNSRRAVCSIITII